MTEHNVANNRRFAVLVSVVEKDNQLHLSLDDVERSEENSRIWHKTVFITSKPINNTFLEELDWSDEDLADFAFTILARIHAFHKCNKL